MFQKPHDSVGRHCKGTEGKQKIRKPSEQKSEDSIGQSLALQFGPTESVIPLFFAPLLCQPRESFTFWKIFPSCLLFAPLRLCVRFFFGCGYATLRLCVRFLSSVAAYENLAGRSKIPKCGHSAPSRAGSKPTEKVTMGPVAQTHRK